MAKEVVLIKVATVCSGIGSPEQALKDLNIKHEVVFACEIDKYARKSYEAIHKANQMFEDMTSYEFHSNSGYSDLFIGGIPCQAFSLAGKRLGELDKRGLLFYDFYSYVGDKRPKIFIIENVKGLLSDAGGKTFSNWQHLLGDCVNGHRQMFNHPDSLGYNLYWTTLNTKDFGLPQNRERVFLVGIRPDIDDNTFRFPIGWKLDKRLKDVLESEVDEKYYLSDKMVENIFTPASEKWQSGKMEIDLDIARPITATVHKMHRADTDNYITVKEATKQGFAVAEPGDSINLSNPNSETRRGRVGKQLANTLDTAYNQAVVEPICVAMRGRNPNNPSDRTTGAPTEQRFEPNSQGITNTITSVQKDNLILLGGIREGKYFNGGETKDYSQGARVYDDSGVSVTLSAQGGGMGAKTGLYNVTNRIRRLTPLECWRLQGFPDEAFYKAKEVNSDTQLYKQAGNSISTPVIGAILKNLIHLL